jgi:hypothetical protein
MNASLETPPLCREPIATKGTALCSSERVSEETPGSLRTPHSSSSNSIFGGQSSLGAVFNQGCGKEWTQGHL